MCSSLNALRIASTAAWSASFSSPRPITRAEAIAAASVSRTASSPMFLSILVPLRCSTAAVQLLQQPVRRAGRLQLGAHADVHRMPEREHGVVRLPVDPVLESNLHPRVRLREMDEKDVVVPGGLEVLHRSLEHRQQDAAPLDLSVGEAEVADEVAARALEEAQVVGVVDDAHLVGVAVDHANGIGLHGGSCITGWRDTRPAACAFVPAAYPAGRRCW